MRRFFFWIMTVLLLSIFCLPTGTAGAASSDFSDKVEGMAEVTNVRVNNGRDKMRIVVDTSKPVTFKTSKLSNPDRVVVDIPNAWLSKSAKRNETVNSPYVAKYRVAQFNKSTVRVVVETKAGDNKIFKLSGGPVPGRVVLDFGNLSGTSSSDQRVIATPDVTPQPEPEPEVQPEPQIQPEPETNNREEKNDRDDRDESAKAPDTENASDIKDLKNITGLKGRKITIDPGHGGNDSGAIGPTGVMEKKVTLRIGNELRRLLTAEGATVYMTRTTDTEVSSKGARATDIEELQARCDVANNHESDIFVSIHMDSFTSGAARGTTGYYYSLGSAKSRRLADCIRSGVIDQIGTPSRGTQSANFYVIKHTDMPATLIEVAFISNPTEEALLNTEDGIKKAAQGIADGIADYFG